MPLSEMAAPRHKTGAETTLQPHCVRWKETCCHDIHPVPDRKRRLVLTDNHRATWEHAGYDSVAKRHQSVTKQHENMWLTTSYKMAARCHSLVEEQNGGLCVCSGKGLPVVRDCWVNWKVQLVLAACHRALCHSGLCGVWHFTKWRPHRGRKRWSKETTGRGVGLLVKGGHGFHGAFWGWGHLWLLLLDEDYPYAT